VSFAPVLRRIVQSSRLRRDLMDLAVIEERRAEPARPLHAIGHRREVYR
jgi:hypothetical protein